MTAVAERSGYLGTNISQVIAHAGVSRPTFYDYFTDKDDCFLAALQEIQQRLLDQVSKAVLAEAPENALEAALRAIVKFAQTEPTAARLLIDEILICGIRALDARDRGITELEDIIERAHNEVDPATPTPDFPVRMLVGGTYRLLAARLRHKEPLTGLASDLLSWVKSYRQPTDEHRWRALQPTPPPAPSPLVPKTKLDAPRPLPRGRPRIGPEQVSTNHRQRILFAAADIAAEKGQAAATIAEITKLAGLDSRAFYRLFSDRQEVFAAVQEIHFEHVMAVSTKAFFTTKSWPERLWEAGRAFSETIEQNPNLAHISFIEFYAAGPIAVKRHNDLLLAFSIFLQEGYRYKPPEIPPSPLALEAIATTNFEMIYHQIRNRLAPQLSSLLAHATHLDLAPFLGPAAANEFIDSMLTKHCAHNN